MSTENCEQNCTIQQVDQNSEVQNDVNELSAVAGGSSDVESNETANDEFNYLKRNEFTSEIYKIEVRNLGYFGIGEFKKLLKSKLNLNMTKIKSPLRKEFAFVCFRSQEDQQRAIETLNGYKWKGKVLQASAAKASADPLQKRRNEHAQREEGAVQPKRQRTSADAICPYANLPYEEQLQKKSIEMQELLKKFTNKLRNINQEAKKILNDFQFDGVKAAPQINGYRNKNEFTVGKNVQGEIVVGFRLGSYADGSVEVSEIQDLPHIPDSAKWAAQSFQQFVRNSNFLPFNPEDNSGHIRQLMVRTSAHTGEIMLVVGVYSSNLNDTEVVDLKSKLREYYETCTENQNGFKCTSLYYQDVKHRQAGQMVSPVEHLSGSTHNTDTIHSLSFKISPLAFFQINTQGAEVLYDKAIQLAAPQPHSTVLDICCGTGTIALAFSKHCKQVLGVEIIPEAIKDAEFNAAANKIGNCKFFAGNADDYIQSMVREVVYGNAPGAPLDLIAVVDPPRAGLHNKSIAAIRAASAIKRLVYISCNPVHAQRNWIELGRPESKQYKGDPFFPKTAIAVDMFPHTTHTELVILFERKAQSVAPGKSEDVKTKDNSDDTPDANQTDIVK
ncbi:tRNA (uracil-5-)-methyltransferase homolog A isoform X1 [Anastrepha obliqua]|uniref:tRNA (uracil-5-)-methyltransferase homolog A isoform X1 n=1 Tax=Anastrepha obliqua TaxID=95512 RepID=UPI0024095D55|nr:tRNA (uracil-5-)-methyltransferase homolog A isoform X1 [Anastrepha obliqua]